MHGTSSSATLDAGGAQRGDTRAEVVDEPLSAAGVLKAINLPADLDVEHVPRTEHDERDLGVALAGRLGPTCRPTRRSRRTIE